MRKPKKKKAVKKTKRAKRPPRRKKKAGFTLPQLFVVERVLEDTAGIKGLLCLIPGMSDEKDKYIFVEKPVFSQVAKFDTVNDATEFLVEHMPGDFTSKVVPLKKHYQLDYSIAHQGPFTTPVYKGSAVNPSITSAIRGARSQFLEDISCVKQAMKDTVDSFKRDCKLLQKDLKNCNAALAKFDKAAKKYA